MHRQPTKKSILSSVCGNKFGQKPTARIMMCSKAQVFNRTNPTKSGEAMILMDSESHRIFILEYFFKKPKAREYLVLEVFAKKPRSQIVNMVKIGFQQPNRQTMAIETNQMPLLISELSAYWCA